MEKFLILHADDLGYNAQQNAAIAELWEKGLLTSTSLLPVAPEAAAGVRFLRESGCPAGVHWVLNSDSDTARGHSRTRAKSLTDGRGLRANALAGWLLAKRREVYAELEAQLLYMLIRATLYGVNGRRFFLDAFELCRKYSLPFRFPKTPGFLERQLGRRLPEPALRLQKMLVACGERRGVRMPDDVVSNPWSMARIRDYETLRRYYLDAVDAAGPGVTEMFFHPAAPNPDAGPEWQKRVYEYELLKSGDLLERAAQKGVRVVSWGVFSELPKP